MRILKLKVADAIHEKVLVLLQPFPPEELEIIDNSYGAVGETSAEVLEEPAIRYFPIILADDSKVPTGVAPGEHDLSKEQVQELDRRVRAYESGEMKGSPWEEVKGELHRQHLSFTAVYQTVPEGIIGFVEEVPGVNVQEPTIEQARSSLNMALCDIFETNRVLAEEGLVGVSCIRESLKR